MFNFVTSARTAKVWSGIHYDDFLIGVSIRDVAGDGMNCKLYTTECRLTQRTRLPNGDN